MFPDTAVIYKTNIIQYKNTVPPSLNYKPFSITNGANANDEISGDGTKHEKFVTF